VGLENWRAWCLFGVTFGLKENEGKKQGGPEWIPGEGGSRMGRLGAWYYGQPEETEQKSVWSSRTGRLGAENKRQVAPSRWEKGGSHSWHGCVKKEGENRGGGGDKKEFLGLVVNRSGDYSDGVFDWD